jgi:hypothetical protein
VGTTSPNFRVVRNANGNWVAENFGAMGCVPQCCFYSNGGNSDVRWSSQLHVASASDTTVGDGGLGHVVNMWNGDAMPILAGMNHTGAAMKASEYVSAAPRQAPDTGAVLPWEPAALVAVAHRTTAAVGTQAFGYSFFVGIPHSGHKVKKKTYTLKTKGPISMISDASGICTFSLLSNAVPTGHPVLYTVSGVWKAEWVGTPGTAWIDCFYFNQDQ